MNLKVSVPEGKSENGRAMIQRFEVSKERAQQSLIRQLAQGHNRGYVQEGRYTRLIVDGELWMSDTRDEQTDHYVAISAFKRCNNGARVLITGLGIGMVLGAALKFPNIAQVDVVELDPDVIEIVGPHYERMARQNGKTLRIIQGDAHNRRKCFPDGDTWHAAWHDIWPTITSDNLPSMLTITRRYMRHTQWQGFWCRDECKRLRRKENDEMKAMGYL